MKNTKAKFSLLLLLVVVMGCTLMGCGSFDATKYVRACLDSCFHGDFTEYKEITKASEEDVTKVYNQLIDSEVNALSAAYTVSDEQKEKFRTLFIDMYKKCKYDVGEATKNSDGSFSVPVTTYKMTVFAGYTEISEKFVTDYMTNNKDATPDQIYAALLDDMYDFIKAKIDAPEYAEGVTENVTVSPSADNPRVYTLNQADLQNIVFKLLDVENQAQ